MPTALHFDCFSGVSGDMTVAALVDVGVPKEVLRNAVASLDLGATLRFERVRKSGLAAVRMTVEAPTEHAHRHLSHVLAILERGDMTPGAKDLATRLFQRLADAEAAVHGIPVAKVHFHEVGAIDSICDFVAISVGIDWLKPTVVTARSVPTGNGMVRCEHGLLPIPAPATARLLAGVPLAACDVVGELTTPTGAAVVAELVRKFTDS
ncbi:MAG: LarC family nickel insertion protein, partial [Planctomycetia bacterium]